MAYSTSWKSSKKPKKQRKYREKSPLHIRGRFLNVHLSPELRKKHEKRTLRVIQGDRVRVMVGQFKGQSGKVEDVNLNSQKVLIEGIDITKTDGTKVQYPVHASNIMITELNLDDDRRQAIIKRK